MTHHNVDTDGDGFVDSVEEMRMESDRNVGDLTAGAVANNPNPLEVFVDQAHSHEGVPTGSAPRPTSTASPMPRARSAHARRSTVDSAAGRCAPMHRPTSRPLRLRRRRPGIASVSPARGPDLDSAPGAR